MKASSAYINTINVPQAKTNWCWAACSENAAKYGPGTGSLSRTQWDAVKYIKGSSTNQYPNVTGTTSDVVTAIHYINSNYNYSAGGKKVYSFLCNQINHGEPPVLGLVNSSTSVGHMVVMNGYYENGSYTSQVRFYNPSASVNANVQTDYYYLCNTGYSNYKYQSTVWKGVN